ncbi:MAG TPA: RNA 2',3'-cyclic phosphodiesterase [Nitrosopumilaceae archaeon]|nr:RNA 2',3'-cyclic phosphodiesterase [Nitrosopumilaceae archaeon]
MRTFVAVEIQNNEVLDNIAKLQSDLKIKAKPVSKENMHFTLLFLGEITEEIAPKIIEELKSITFIPIQISFGGVGAFPNPRFPRVIWIGVDETASQNLVKLAKQVEEKLVPLGFKSDKPFKPHLTIFRIKNNIGDISNELDKLKTIQLGHDTITELKFKKSILTPSGPIYTDLQVIKAK